MSPIENVSDRVRGRGRGGMAVCECVAVCCTRSTTLCNALQHSATRSTSEGARMSENGTDKSVGVCDSMLQRERRAQTKRVRKRAGFVAKRDLDLQGSFHAGQFRSICRKSSTIQGSFAKRALKLQDSFAAGDYATCPQLICL